MEVIAIFAILTGIIILGYLSEMLFRKTFIPDVLLLILVGIALRWGFGIIHPDNFGSGQKIFATFALVYLLFRGAMTIDFKSLFSSLKRASMLTFLAFFLTVAVVSSMSILLFGLEVNQGLLLGMILGGTSSAVVIPLVSMLKMDKKNSSTLVLESAITDVLCIVGSITMMNIILTGQTSGTDIVKNILSSFSLAIVIGIIAGLIWIKMLSRSEGLRRSYMVTIAVVIGLYALIESPFVSASGAIGALAFGLVLGNSSTILGLTKKKEEGKDDVSMLPVISKSAENFYNEISFFVKVFFFVYLGIIMEFSELYVYLISFAIVLAVYAIRPFAVYITHRNENVSVLDRVSLEVLIPKGLAAAVLVQLTIQQGIPGSEDLLSPVLSIIFISIILTSILVFLSRKAGFRGFWPFLQYRGQNAKAAKSPDSKDDDGSKGLPE